MITAIATPKGGVGKTTTSISLASGLARKGKRVLLIDVDPQANSSKVLVESYKALNKEQTVYETIINRKDLFTVQSKVENLTIVPSHILVADTDMALAVVKDNRANRLKTALNEISDKYDHVFIDTPPNLGWLTINALAAADDVIVPVAPGYFEVESIDQMLKLLQEIRSEYNPTLLLKGLLFTMKTPNQESVESYRILQKHYGNILLTTHIPRNNDVSKAFMQKTDIFDFAPYSTSGQSYLTLIDELYFNNQE
jgi:chromosome partitioning protein